MSGVASSSRLPGVAVPFSAPPIRSGNSAKQPARSALSKRKGKGKAVAASSEPPNTSAATKPKQRRKKKLTKTRFEPVAASSGSDSDDEDYGGRRRGHHGRRNSSRESSATPGLPTDVMGAEGDDGPAAMDWMDPRLLLPQKGERYTAPHGKALKNLEYAGYCQAVGDVVKGQSGLGVSLLEWGDIVEKRQAALARAKVEAGDDEEHDEDEEPSRIPHAQILSQMTRWPLPLDSLPSGYTAPSTSQSSLLSISSVFRDLLTTATYRIKATTRPRKKLKVRPRSAYESQAPLAKPPRDSTIATNVADGADEDEDPMWRAGTSDSDVSSLFDDSDALSSSLDSPCYSSSSDAEPNSKAPLRQVRKLKSTLTHVLDGLVAEVEPTSYPPRDWWDAQKRSHISRTVYRMEKAVGWKEVLKIAEKDRTLSDGVIYTLKKQLEKLYGTPGSSPSARPAPEIDIPTNISIQLPPPPEVPVAKGRRQRIPAAPEPRAYARLAFKKRQRERAAQADDNGRPRKRAKLSAKSRSNSEDVPLIDEYSLEQPMSVDGGSGRKASTRSLSAAPSQVPAPPSSVAGSPFPDLDLPTTPYPPSSAHHSDESSAEEGEEEEEVDPAAPRREWHRPKSKGRPIDVWWIGKSYWVPRWVPRDELPEKLQRRLGRQEQRQKKKIADRRGLGATAPEGHRVWEDPWESSGKKWWVGKSQKVPSWVPKDEVEEEKDRLGVRKKEKVGSKTASPAPASLPPSRQQSPEMGGNPMLQPAFRTIYHHPDPKSTKTWWILKRGPRPNWVSPDDLPKNLPKSVTKQWLDQPQRGAIHWRKKNTNLVDSDLGEEAEQEDGPPSGGGQQRDEYSSIFEELAALPLANANGVLDAEEHNGNDKEAQAGGSGLRWGEVFEHTAGQNTMLSS